MPVEVHTGVQVNRWVVVTAEDELEGITPRQLFDLLEVTGEDPAHRKPRISEGLDYGLSLFLLGCEEQKVDRGRR